MLEKLVKSKFVSGGIWYTVGNILIKGITFLTLPLFTRMLTTSEYGYYNTYIAYQSIISVIIGLGLSGSIKNGKIDYKDSYEKFVSSVISLDVIALLASLIIINLAGIIFPNLMPMNRPMLNVLVITSSASTVIEIMSAKWVIELQYKKYIAVAFTNTVVNVLLSIVLIKFAFEQDKYWGRIIGESVPFIIIAAFLVIYMLGRNKTLFKSEYWKYALKIGLPLVPHMLSKILLVQFDRIMLSKMTDTGVTGIYSCMYNISSILNVLLNSFDMVWIAWLYPKMQNKDYSAIKKMTKMYVGFFSVVCVCFVLVMPEVLKIFVAEEYQSGIDAAFILIYVVYINFIYLFFVNVEFYFKDTVYSSIGTAIAAIINIILNAILIPEYGYIGAAMATVISYFILSVVHYFIYKIRYKLNVVSVLSLVAGSLITMIIMVGIYQLRMYIVLRYGILIVLTFMALTVILRKKGNLR